MPTTTISMSSEMEVGETRAGIEIFARKKWNDIGILVSSGQRYSFSGDGTWVDGGIRSGPDGFRIEEAPWVSRWLLRMFAPKRRLPDTAYFCLSGSIARDPARCFPIGMTLGSWLVEGTSGELCCLANDVALAYFNNTGSIRLSVTRLA